MTQVLLALSLLLNGYLLFAPEGDGDTEAETPAAEETAEAVAVPINDGVYAVEVEVRGNLAQVLVAALGEEQGPWVAATTNRLLMWNLDPSRDQRPGDRLRVLFEETGRAGEVSILHAAYDSQKFRTTFEAYRYQPEGWPFAGYFNEVGVEVAYRLAESPIEHYEQIIALVGDGRGHRGMDFKAPVGTPVLLPAEATILRRNWNFQFNGNCLEVRYRRDGTLARFLHLSSVEDVAENGAVLPAGTVVAMSGNTGRSFGPHLHYELQRGERGRVLDPLEYHGGTHHTLEGQENTDYLAERDRLRELLGERLAIRSTGPSDTASEGSAPEAG